LVVREHEDGVGVVLEGAFLTPLFDFLPEFFELEALGDGDLAQTVLGDEGCKLGQGVTTCATLADEHAVAFAELDDSVDLAHVGDGLVE